MQPSLKNKEKLIPPKSIPLLEKQLKNEAVDGWSANNHQEYKGQQDLSADFSLLKRIEGDDTNRGFDLSHPEP